SHLGETSRARTDRKSLREFGTGLRFSPWATEVAVTDRVTEWRGIAPKLKSQLTTLSGSL
ncbi:MAG: hypothetical protein V3V82_03920, partial [Acidimicrobiia bacterium]